MSLQHLAQEALDVQDACNPIAVANRFREVVINLRDLEQRDMDAIRRHPVFRMWASKINDMAGLGINDWQPFSQAYDACRALAEGE